MWAQVIVFKMERRDFLKKSCSACVGMSLLLPLLESCGTSAAVFKTIPENNRLTIPKTVFETQPYAIIRAQKISYDILLKKSENDQFYAIYMKCTHRDSPVQFTKTGFVCNDHGSRFTIEGEVTKSPAKNNLTRLPVETDAQSVFILIPKELI